jgi:glycosyltransferase involved in cell wall biosynthesis
MSPPKPEHVHVLIDSLTWGGAETVLADFASGAQNAGMEVTVAYMTPRSEAAGKLRKLGIEPELVPIKSLLGRSDRRMVRDHIAARSPDLLHTHLGNSDFLGGLAARRLGIPTVSTLHIMEWTNNFRDRVKSVLMAWARRRCAYRVIAVSDAQRQAYVSGHWDRPGHVVTIHNGIGGEVRPGEGRALREQLGIAPDDLVVSMIGVIREGKGHDLAIEAIAELRGELPQVRLLVVGDGPIRADVERMAEKLDSAAVFTGYQDDVLGYLDASDVLIQPSHVDALPTSLMEAMAARVPVLATAVGGIPEIAVDGETGLLMEPPPTVEKISAGLRSLLEDPALRERLGEAGRRRFEASFSREGWIARLLDLYGEAMHARAVQ